MYAFVLTEVIGTVGAAFSKSPSTGGHNDIWIIISPSNLIFAMCAIFMLRTMSPFISPSRSRLHAKHESLYQIVGHVNHSSKSMTFALTDRHYSAPSSHFLNLRLSYPEHICDVAVRACESFDAARSVSFSGVSVVSSSAGEQKSMKLYIHSR